METANVKSIRTDYQGSVQTLNIKVILVQNILLVLYIVIPIAAGADKFLNILTQWTNYLNPLIPRLTGISAGLFMNIVGIVEIAAGVIVLFNHRVGAYIVSIWLVGIALQLIIGGMYLDVAVRDLAMAAGAFCLGVLSDK